MKTLARLGAGLCLVLATCAPRPSHILAPETAQTLSLVADATPPRPSVTRVLRGDRGVYLLTTSGVFEGVFPGAARGELAPPRRWSDAAEIPALDGSGVWTLAIDAQGIIHRLRAGSGGGLEPMNDRLGVPKTARHLAAAGAALAVLTDDGLYFVERERISRVDVKGRELAATRNVAAVVGAPGPNGEGSVVVVDLASKRIRLFAIDEPRRVGFTRGDVLVVATARAIYRENGSGELALRYVADDEIGALAIEGDLVWFSDGKRLGVIEDDHAKLTAEVDGDVISAITPTANDVWIVEGDRARRLERANQSWPPAVEQLVRTACLPCHAAGGAGGLELSSPSAFRAHQSDVIRALATNAMPPSSAPHPLSEGDRDRLLDWARAARER